MGPFVKGDVVVIPFPFSDLSSTKNRPALVLAAPKRDEVLVCQITSQSSRGKYAIELTDNDLKQGQLKVDSYIRPNHIFLAEPRIITRHIGKINSKKLKEVISEAVNIIKNT